MHDYDNRGEGLKGETKSGTKSTTLVKKLHNPPEGKIFFYDQTRKNKLFHTDNEKKSTATHGMAQ